GECLRRCHEPNRSGSAGSVPSMVCSTPHTIAQSLPGDITNCTLSSCTRSSTCISRQSDGLVSSTVWSKIGVVEPAASGRMSCGCISDEDTWTWNFSGSTRSTPSVPQYTGRPLLVSHAQPHSAPPVFTANGAAGVPSPASPHAVISVSEPAPPGHAPTSPRGVYGVTPSSSVSVVVPSLL